MKLSGATVFYWISKEFPDAVYKKSTSLPGKKYARPMFWENGGHPCEQIVVIPAGTEAGSVSLHRSVLPVVIGTTQVASDECIRLPEDSNCFRLFNALQGIFDRFQSWSGAMEQATTVLCSYDTIIQGCSPLLEDPICLSDDHFQYVSYSRILAQKSGYEEKYVDEGNYLPLEYINQLTAMPDYKESEMYLDVYPYTCVDEVYHKNIFYENHFVGRLTLPRSENEAKNEYYRSFLREIADYVERLYAELGSFWGRRSTLPQLSAMLRSLLGGQQVEMDALTRLLSNHGYRSGDLFSLVQMRSHFITNESKMTYALTSQLEKLWPGSCCMVHNQKLIVFLNMSHYKRCTDKLFRQELAVFLREGLLVAGISREFSDIQTIQAAYLQTEIALDAGEQLNPTYWYFKYDDYSYWDLLHHGCRTFLPEQVCHPAINILIAYDKKNHTELCDTLKAYIVHKYNAVGTSDALCVARSTFLKRLSRIEELTSLDLQAFSTRSYLALSFELLAQYSDRTTTASERMRGAVAMGRKA